MKNKKFLKSLSVKIMAGFLALLMIAGVVFMVLSYVIH